MSQPIIPPLSDELIAVLQQKQQENGSCQILQVNDTPESRKAVAALTSKTPGGGGHELITAENPYDPSRSVIVVGLGERGTDYSTWEEDYDTLKSAILEKISPEDSFDSDATGIVVLCDNMVKETAVDLAGMLKKSIISTEGEMSMTQFPSGDVAYYNKLGHPLNKTTPDDETQELSFTSFISRAVAMNEITSYSSPLDNYKAWLQYSSDSPFNRQMERENSRGKFGFELEVINISEDRNDMVDAKKKMCDNNLYSILELEDLEVAQLSGGHKDVETSSGNNTTVVLEHANMETPILESRHHEWVDDLITSLLAPNGSLRPAILLTCNVEPEDALRIAKESRRPIVFSPDKVLIQIQYEGDCKGTTMENKGFFIAQPDGVTIKPGGASVFLSRSPRVDMALNNYQGDFEEEEEDIPELPPLQFFPGVQLHHPPFDLNTYLTQNIVTQLQQQQQQFAQQQHWNPDPSGGRGHRGPRW